MLLARPCSIKLTSNFKLAIPYWVAPIAGVLILLAYGRLDWADIWTSISGWNQIQPYRILILFMALAYIMLSLVSATGLGTLYRVGQ